MITRKVGKLLRGNATGFQIMAACVLGSLAAAVPGFGQGPLLYLLLFCTIVILNANLFISALCFLVVKVILLLLLPLLFQVGIWLLEGPLSGAVATLVNMPVVAWFGLEYYVTLPSLVLALVIGLAAGLGLCGSLRRFHRWMADLESGSERFRAIEDKRAVRLLAWIFFGGLKGSKSWEELAADKRLGLPVRPIGIVFVVSLVILLVVALKLIDTSIVTHYARGQLELVNGATVDLESLSLDVANKRMVIRGLAMADPEDLMRNRFAADTIEIDISGMSLLAKKAVIDRVAVMDARTGSERRIRGKAVATPERERRQLELPEGSLEGYLGQAEVIRERLQALRRIYDRLAPYLEKGEPVAAEGAEPPVLSWKERLVQRARERGYAQIRSDNLVRGTPRLLIREIEADRIVAGTDQVFALVARNLSTQPALVAENGSVRLTRADGLLDAQLTLPSAEAPAMSRLSVRYRDWRIDDLAAQIGRGLPMQGGTMNIEGEGSIDSAVLDLPLTVTLFGTTLNAFGSSVPLNNFPVQVRLHGPLDSLQLDIPKGAIEAAIKEGGRQRVRGIIEEKAPEPLRRILSFGGGG